MKQRMRRWGSFLLAVSLVLTCFPAVAVAAPARLGSYTHWQTETVYCPGAMEADQGLRVIAPAGEPVAHRGLVQPFGEEEYLTNVDQVGAVLREGMKNRQETVTIYYEAPADTDFYVLSDAFWAVAFTHTGNPTEGDYLRLHFDGGYTQASGSTDGTTNWYTITFALRYYTTAQQEAQVDAAAAQLLSELDLTGKSNYEKLCAVYDWLCDNITYDYDNLDDDAYMLKYTAYAALVDRTSVCQGYANLLYRLLLTLGIDCRVITGERTSTGEGHAWNIVRLDGLYYNLDATWDTSYAQIDYPYEYFLRADATFDDHTRDVEFITADFYAAYPMGTADYDPNSSIHTHHYQGIETPPTCTEAGYTTYTCTCGDSYTADEVSALDHDYVDGNCSRCGEADPDQPVAGIAESAVFGNQTWTLYTNGLLTISGEGEMLDGGAGPGAMNEWAYLVDQATSVVIEDGVTSICYEAFGDAVNLTSITIGNTVTDIDSGAFHGCTGLTSITIPASVTRIAYGVFEGCTGLTAILVEEGNSNYCSLDGALYTKDMTGLHTCPAGKVGAFSIPSGVTSIGGSAFSGCTGLTGITIPVGVTHIGSSAFWRCTGLTAIAIPDGVSQIGYSAFTGCTGLASITIPASVTQIESSAFSGCTGLTDIWVNENNSSYCALDGVLFTKDMNTLLFCTVAKQGDYSIPDGVTTIDHYAFDGCRMLTSITIPASVTSIGDGAFCNCSSLTAITFCGDAPQMLEFAPPDQMGSLDGVYATIYYPAGNATWAAFLSDMDAWGIVYGCDCSLTWLPYEAHTHSYTKVVFDPTCESNGYTFYTCTCGDSYVSDHVEALGHSFAADTIAPTCTVQGYTVYTCTNCGTYYTEDYVRPTGHSYTPNVTAPTCESEGYTTYICHCGDSYVTDWTAPTGHSHTAVVTAPTCTEGGYTTYTCVCGDSYVSDKVSALGHSSDSWTQLKAPTCTEGGMEECVCSRCGKQVQRELPALGHSYVESVSEATCTLWGCTTYTCTVCQYWYATQNEAPLGHQEVVYPAVEPTCTESGLTEGRHCDRCGVVVTAQEFLPALGHSYSSAVTAPTCTEKGYTTHTCATCGATYLSDETAPLGHSYTAVVTAPTCTVMGYTTYTCTCGDSYKTDFVDHLDHDFAGDATVCARCGMDKPLDYGFADGTYWVLNHDGTLVIAPSPFCVPELYREPKWDTYGPEIISQVTTIIFQDGMLHVLGEALCAFSNVSLIVLPESFWMLEASAFTFPESGTDLYFAGDPYDWEMQVAYNEVFPATVRIHLTADEPDTHVLSQTVEATCQSGGYTQYSCGCGHSWTAEHTPATDHSWDEGIVTIEPTKEAEGEKTYTCAACGGTKTEVLPKLPDVTYDVPEDDSVQIPENDCFEGGTTVKVEEVTEEEVKEAVAEAMKDVAQQYIAYEFTATKDDAQVQPSGKLTVTFTIPEGYSNNVTVYYMAPNGELHKLDAVVNSQDRTVTVQLEHFSTYILVDEDTAPAVLLGDVNGDGRVNARDARALLRYIASPEDGGEIDTVAADLTDDGRINARDARALLRLIAEQ